GLALSVSWIAIASLARAATLKAVLAYFHEGTEAELPRSSTEHWQVGSLIGLNFLRAAATLAAAVGCLAAILLGGEATSATDPSPGSAMLITLGVAVAVSLAWSVVNWLLSLAAVLAVTDGEDVFGAIAAAVDLCRTR